MQSTLSHKLWKFNTALTFIWMIILVLFLFVALKTSYNINHDVAFYIQCARLILKGNTPYVDFYDNNPPLIMYFSCIPEILSYSYFTASLWMHAIVLGMITVSSVAMMSLFRRCKEIESVGRIWFCSWIFLNILTLRTGEFGQREHLFAIVSLPYMILRIFRDRINPIPNRAALFCLGLYCAFGAMLKPYFIFCHRYS